MLDEARAAIARRSALHVRRGRSRALAAGRAGRSRLQQRGAALAARSRGAVCARGRDGGARRRARRADAGQFPRAVAHDDRRPRAQRALAREAGRHRARAAGRRGRPIISRGSRRAWRASTSGAPNTCRCCRRAATASIRSRRGPRARGSFRSSRRSMRASGREFLRDYMQRLSRRLSAARRRPHAVSVPAPVHRRQPVRPPDQCADRARRSKINVTAAP